MKCFRNASIKITWVATRRGAAATLLALSAVSLAWATVEWKNVEAQSTIEATLYRWMPMPVGKVLGLRPPREAVQQLGELIQKQPTAELYSLRAMNEEAALDFGAAEADWKRYVAASPGNLQAQLALADFYARRMRAADEIAALTVVARAPSTATDKLNPPEQQLSWQAFQRIESVARRAGLPWSTADANFRAWIVRYPDQRDVYSRYLLFLLDHKAFAEAEGLTAQYQEAFPSDGFIFQVKAQALVEYRKNSVEQGLAVYDKRFQPLWPAELIESYFELLRHTHALRKYLDDARAAFERNPEDLTAAARIFYYYQQQGQNDAAQQALADYASKKEQRKTTWSSQELLTVAGLHERIRAYPEAARYYYALYNSKGSADAQQLAIAGLANVMLEVPEQAIRFGSGDLSMYQDIATLDPGPGFLNGILSLILNSTSPGYAYSEEERRAVPYFHRAKAAELLRLLDSRFPRAPRRPELHASLLRAYSGYGESDSVIRDGRQFLSEFRDSPQRIEVALLMADAFARTKRMQEEFAVYDALLAELALKADHVPLGTSSTSAAIAPEPQREPEEESEEGTEGQEVPAASERAFSVASRNGRGPQSGARSPEYARILERYVSRLVSTGDVPRALAVLRGEIDRNPNDPGLYERMAQFLDQNRLGEQQEQVYQRAIQQFQDRSWYHKLARFYIRHRRNAEFERLSEQVIKIFSGTELESYFASVVTGSDYYRRLNEYAHARFPHDLVFVRNLLQAYRRDTPEWERLLREHWAEAEDLRNRYFEYLSRTGRLDQELAALEQAETAVQKQKWQDLAGANPLATRFIAEAGLWRSHFEQAAEPIGALAQQFPADSELARRASAVFRSLAAFEPKYTQPAVAIEEKLYEADPRNRETLARIGDIFADRELFASATPYWNRMAQVYPGEPQAYIDSATVFWDYYRFDDALRVLREGRAKLNDPTLFSYEIGAIYENKREYPQAIAEYVKGAVQENSRCRSRLLDLARRSAHAAGVRQAATALAEAPAAELGAIKLYTSVLEAQDRPKDLEQFLAGIARQSNSLELLEWLETAARQKSLVAVERAALEKQVEVSTDPVRRLELRYSLIRFYENRQEMDAAQRNVEEVYRENLRLLGVVRATVDFYWRNKQVGRAVDVLTEAARSSYPALASQFVFEAARKSTEAGYYERARLLLAQLLTESPYNAEYLAAAAGTYAKAGDDQGLKAFYVKKISQLRGAQLDPGVRDQRMAALRRGLIPALNRLKDFSGAVDQYIEIINRYPEDGAVVAEAALYAQSHALQERLLSFYGEQVKRSPRDYRWPMVLAEIQRQLENYPAAIDTYALAIRIRPDRVDLRAARADLLERLMRFDEAAADYQRLFELNYHDTTWMEKVATVRARQGRVADTVAALRLALIDNRPEKPENFFEAARRLESWAMLPQAKEFAQKGVDSAGRDLLAVPEHHAGAELYVRILTRLRENEMAYRRMQTALADAASLRASISVTVQHVEKNGIGSITDKQWRDRAIAVRRDAARAGLASALRSMGDVVAANFTPEEKAAFTIFLDTNAANASDADIAALFLPAARAASLADQEARWLERLMLANGPGGGAYKSQLIDLQSRRLRFDELGAQLQQYAALLTLEQGRQQVLLQAANAYRASEDYVSELGVLGRLRNFISAEVEQRYLGLLLQYQPNQLVQLAASSEKYADLATQYAIEHADEKLALEAVTMRGRSRPPVWTKGYLGLTGLYFGDRGPNVQASFISALGDATIGERIGKHPSRDQQLAGNVWFYYGSRYGEWLGVSKSGEAEDFLPALLEQSPGSASGYIATASYYEGAGELERAVQDYGRALELAPQRADIRDSLAAVYWRQQKRGDAVAEWRRALELLDSEVERVAVPASFWPTFRSIMGHLGSRRILSEVRPQANTVLRDYVRKNGTYQVEELLQSAVNAMHDPQAGTAWMLELSAVTPEPRSFLEQLIRASWIPLSAREPLYVSLLDRAQRHAREAQGLERQYAQQDLRRWQLEWVRYLVDMRQIDRAAGVLRSLPTAELTPADELELTLRIASEQNELDSLLDRYRADPERAPATDLFEQSARIFQRAGQRTAARKVLEYVFSREIAAHNLTAANLLGLAEIRLQEGDAPGALQLLRRLTVAVGQPFENLNAAASLLSRTGHHAEALEFLQELVKSTPWQPNYRVRLAQEQIAAGRNTAAALGAVLQTAGDKEVAYDDRARAAVLLAGTAGSKLGSAELDVLAGAQPIPPSVADAPFFFLARVRSAEKAADPQVRERLLRNALTDDPNRNSARIAMFRAFVALGREQLAISAIKPLLSRGMGESYYQARYASDDFGRTYEPAQADYLQPGAEQEKSSRSNETVTEIPVYPPTDLQSLPPEERTRVYAEVARAYEKLGQLDSALEYFRKAAQAGSKTSRAQMEREITRVREIMRHNAENRQRAPMIHDDMEQERLVHQKLAALPATSPGAQAGSGGARR